MVSPLNVGSLSCIRELSQLSYFQLGLLLYVVVSSLSSHLHVIARLTSIEGI